MEAEWDYLEGSPTLIQENEPGPKVRGIVEPSKLESMRSLLESTKVGSVSQTVIMGIRGCPYTLSEMMAFVAIAQERLPCHEVFMDGDEYAVVARTRRFSA